MAHLRLRRQLAVGAAATLVLVAALEIGPDRSVLSRGRLLPQHHDISCGQCHEPFASFARDNECVHCHREDRTGPGDEFRRMRCVACHWEHRGRRPLPPERMRAVCLKCHGTAELTEEGTGDGPLLDFHPRHRPGAARRR